MAWIVSVLYPHGSQFVIPTTMPLEAVEFDGWWEEFLANHRQVKDPYDTLRELQQYVEGLPVQKCNAFANELANLAASRGEGWHLAASVLETIARTRERDIVASALRLIRSVHPPHPDGDYRIALLRVLASDPDGTHLASVERFFAEPVGLGWTLLRTNGMKFDLPVARTRNNKSVNVRTGMV